MSITKAYSGAYSALGSVFEYFNDDCGYDKWSQYLIDRLQGLGAGAVGIDIGCGNGYFTRALYKAGYSVTGLDSSPQMLSTAVDLAAKHRVKADFILQDVTKLSLNFKPDFAVAVNDCVNYIPPQKLQATFARVHKCLKKGGLFLFDVSSEHKLRHIVGSNLFARDFDNATLLWFNTLSGDRVDMDVTVFTRLPDGKYTRADERQTQYIYGETQILTALTQCGFAAEAEGHLGGDKAERINFICKKL